MSDCCKISSGSPLAYYHADLCSMGLICPPWSSCWFLSSVISMYRPFDWCQLLQNVSGVPSCSLLLQTGAPWGSFVPYGSPYGSNGQKSLYVDPLMGVQMLQNVCNVPFCLLSLQTCAPWGSFVFMELLLVPVVGKNHYMSPIDGCPTAVKCLQCPHLLITIADLCPMVLICPLWIMVPVVRNHYM